MDRSRAAEATDEARHAINDANATGDTEITIRIAADAEGTQLLDEPRTHCPARLPCLGLTGQRIAVPVRVVASADAPQRIGEQVGEIKATMCTVCRAVKADERT
jgi:hypothetical protein